MSAPEDESIGELMELPLFPLNVVLYPGMFLPLHIFEDRYRTMIGNCLQYKQPFGVVLIKEGSEVGAPATPEQIGTTARILDSAQLESGRLNILTRGDRRFQILKVLREEPYLVGRIRLLDDKVGDDAAEKADIARVEFETFQSRFARLTGEAAKDVAPTDEATELSFSIAAKISSCVKLPAETRQYWLAINDAEARLETLIPTLQKLNEALEEEFQRRATDTSLN